MFRAVSRRINIFRALLLTSGKERDPDSDAEKKIKILSILAAKTLKLPTASAFSSDSEKNEHIQRLADKIRELTVDELDELLISVRKIVIPEQSVKKLEKGEQKVPGIVACFAMTMAAAKEGENQKDSAGKPVETIPPRLRPPKARLVQKWPPISFLLEERYVSTFSNLFHSLGTMEVIEMVAHSSEFENNVVQEEEQNELAMLARTSCPLEVRGGPSNKRGKISILIQPYISRGSIDSFSLVSDAAYIGIWPHQHPRRQFDKDLSLEISRKLEERGADLDRLHEMEEKDIGALIRYAPGGRVSVMISNTWF
ncbi:hypothetical protein V6N13_013265 [Hibiscus sabdariffa]